MSGRWLNRDPLEEEYDLNLYSYAYQDPIDYLDPDGAGPQMPGRNEGGQETSHGGTKADDKSAGDRRSNKDSSGRQDRPKQQKDKECPKPKGPEFDMNPHARPGEITPPKDYLPPRVNYYHQPFSLSPSGAFQYHPQTYGVFANPGAVYGSAVAGSMVIGAGVVALRYAR